MSGESDTTGLRSARRQKQNWVAVCTKTKTQLCVALCPKTDTSGFRSVRRLKDFWFLVYPKTMTPLVWVCPKTKTKFGCCLSEDKDTIHEMFKVLRHTEFLKSDSRSIFCPSPLPLGHFYNLYALAMLISESFIYHCN